MAGPPEDRPSPPPPQRLLPLLLLSSFPRSRPFLRPLFLALADRQLLERSLFNPARMQVALTESQVREIEAANPEGLTSQELVAAFSSRQIRFSEATLRKYVQLGLVPRSRRVGRKGKHLGSRGVYPVRAVRRINTIKRLMAERYTIEEIQARFLTFKDSIETLDEALGELLRLFEQKVAEQQPSRARQRLESELQSIKGTADGLLESVHRLEKLLISAAETQRPRGGGAASPTELL